MKTIASLVLLILVTGCTAASVEETAEADRIAENLDVARDVNQSAEAEETGIPDIGSLPDTTGAGLEELGSFGSDTTIPASIDVVG